LYAHSGTSEKPSQKYMKTNSTRGIERHPSAAKAVGVNYRLYSLNSA